MSTETKGSRKPKSRKQTPPSKTKAAEAADRKGQQANIRQNTTHQGYQQNR